MADYTSFKERLEDVHTFPTHYIAKAIVTNAPEPIEKVTETAKEILQNIEDVEIGQAPSSKANYVSLRIGFTAPNAHIIVQLYEALGSIEEVKFLT